MDLPSLGFQEYVLIFLPFFLLGLLRGWRTADCPRAERILSHGRVSKGIAVLALTVLGYFLVVSILEGSGFWQVVRWVFSGLVVVFFSLLFGLPFVVGLLFWPQRRKTKDPT
jgi:hypothetical protein